LSTPKIYYINIIIKYIVSSAHAQINRVSFEICTKKITQFIDVHLLNILIILLGFIFLQARHA